MTLEHVAIWTHRLETLRDFYTQHFNGIANHKYVNPVTGLESYFLSFDSGARLEIMQKPGIPLTQNELDQHYTGITHLAFAVSTMKEVDEKASELRQAGYTILRGPRKTGDGYYEFETLDPDNNRLEVCAPWRD